MGLHELKGRLSPAIRISFGLILLIISTLLAADLFGIIPNESKATLDARQKISEALAVHFTILSTTNDMRKMNFSLKTLVERDDDIVSAGLRTNEGQLVYEAGDHGQNWVRSDTSKSTTTQVIVPIFRGKKVWGTVEILFQPLSQGIGQMIVSRSTLSLTLFVSILGFIGFLIIILRTLRQLDPSAVIPDRVNSAFNTLAEGVLILDEKAQIVLANTAFAEQVGQSPDSLIGYKASELNWRTISEADSEPNYPWLTTLETNESQISVPLALETPSGDIRVLAANCAPISDNRGKTRGALVTFDDVTELETKNNQLNEMVTTLEVSQAEVQKKNKELHHLATRDPLTGCLNRRAFNEKFEVLFNQAKKDGSELSCIMADIDHFKLVNDNYGHGVGDEVIILLAEILQVLSNMKWP